jgi:cytochrome c biogenesis protein
MLHVNSFDVRYREDGSVEQFVSDLSIFDPQGREALRKSISVNDPLRYQARVVI